MSHRTTSRLQEIQTIPFKYSSTNHECLSSRESKGHSKKKVGAHLKKNYEEKLRTSKSNENDGLKEWPIRLSARFIQNTRKKKRTYERIVFIGTNYDLTIN